MKGSLFLFIICPFFDMINAIVTMHVIWREKTLGQRQQETG